MMTEVKDGGERRDGRRWRGGARTMERRREAMEGEEREGGEGGKEKSPERSKEPTGARSMDL